MLYNIILSLTFASVFHGIRFKVRRLFVVMTSNFFFATAMPVTCNTAITYKHIPLSACFSIQSFFVVLYYDDNVKPNVINRFITL